MITAVIGAVFIFDGIFQLVTHRPLGGDKDRELYTTESYAKSITYSGIVLMIAGIVWLVNGIIDLASPGTISSGMSWGIDIVVIVLVIIAMVLLVKLRVKK